MSSTSRLDIKDFLHDLAQNGYRQTAIVKVTEIDYRFMLSTSSYALSIGTISRGSAIQSWIPNRMGDWLLSLSDTPSFISDRLFRFSLLINYEKS